jgi:hypothetical protein
MLHRLWACLVLTLLAAAPAAAATDPKYKAGWEASFSYIESSFSEGILVDTAFDLLPSKYIPYLSQAKKIMARAANNLELRLKPLGLDASKYSYTSFDGVQLLRVVYALERGKVGNLNAGIQPVPLAGSAMRGRCEGCDL